MTVHVDLDCLAGVVFIRFPFLPLFHTVLFGRKSLWAHVKTGELHPLFWGEYLHKCFGILLHGRFVASPPLIG